MIAQRSLLFVFALLALTLVAPRQARGDGSYSAAATKTTEKITIDGTMSEPAWKTAPALDRWHQTRITEGALAREQTDVRILYDRDNLYFGFHCFDSQPKKVAAYTVQNEGFLHQDDNVTIIIDTFLDHRNAYYFWTNALGVRTDGRIVNDGEQFSTDWQGEWEAKGSIVADGWIVEVRIPFSNFQYEDRDEHTFGILLDREQNRLQEWSNWTPDGVNSAKVSRYSHLTGLRGIAPRSRFGVTGYVSGQLSLKPGQSPSFVPNAGVDARFTPAPWASVKLTANPDFAQVDIDQDVLWLDTVERVLPERRPFFLEGGDLFVSPIRLFNSRRIAPQSSDRVFGGVLATGKRDGLGFSVLDVQSRQHRRNGTQEDSNSAVVRVQKDVGARSAVSAVGLSRFGDTKNGVAGADINLHVWDEFFFLGQAAKSFGPKGDKGAEAYHAEVHRFDTNSEFWLQYEDIGKSFDDPLGYVPVVDVQRIYTHGNYTWFTKKKALPRVDAAYDDLWELDHTGKETRHQRSGSIQPYLSDDFALTVGARFNHTGKYDTNLGSLSFIVLPNDWESVTLTGITGSFLGGTFLGVNGAASFKIGNHLALKLSGFYTISWDVPNDSLLFKTAAYGSQLALYAQARWQFTPDLYTRLTFQRGEVLGIADLGQIQGQVIDAVFGWHYRVGSDAFLVYTQQPLLGEQEHRLLAKVSLSY
jgi:hypothetical protein